MSTRTLALALSTAVLAAQLVAPTATAGERRDTRNPFDNVATVSLRVPMHDLDPTTVRGATALYGRIEIAANRICAAPRDRHDGLAKRRELERAARCFEAVVDKAVADLRATANVDIAQLAGAARVSATRLSAAR